jgi:predicted ATP-grasp superfamily ATP-dependent carboligase
VNGYGILRSLARKGIPLVGFYNDSAELGRYSKHGTAVHIKSAKIEADIADMLIDVRSEYDKRPVLFSASDEFTLFLAKNRERLSEHFEYHWVPIECLSGVIEKSRMSTISREAGVLSPRTYVTGLDEDVARSAVDFEYPCIVKPTRSFNTAFPAGQKCCVIHSAEGLINLYEKYPNLRGYTIWQEIIEGDDDQVYQCTVLIKKSGEMGAACTVRKIRQSPPGFGNMCFGRSDVDVGLIPQTAKLLNYLQYRGLASLEFKFSRKDNRWYFIEMNPRLPWYSSLFAASGVNLPCLVYADLTKDPEFAAENTQQKPHIYWISLASDLNSFLERREREGLSIWKWLKSATKARAFAWLDVRDPLPFAMAAIHLVLNLTRRLLTRMLHTIRPGGEE